MTKEAAIVWLKALELYFQQRAIMSQEDIEIIAYTQNALNAKKVAELLK